MSINNFSEKIPSFVPKNQSQKLENSEAAKNKIVRELSPDKKFLKVWNEYIWPISSLVGGLRPLHSWALGKFADIKEGQKVLEVGSGYPLYKLYADNVGKDGLFVSLDIQPNIQLRSKKILYWMDKLMKHKNNIELTIANAEKLPFDDNTFDRLIMSNLNSGNTKAVVSEVFRVLKPKGKYIASFLEPSPRIIESIEQAAKNSGFVNTNIQKGTFAPPVGPSNWYLEAEKPKLLQEKEDTNN